MQPLDALHRLPSCRVITGSAMRPYLQAVMAGCPSDNTICVIQPQTLTALWQAINIAAQADWILLPQAANTSLTGGSTPNGHYPRPVCVISMQQLKGIMLLNQGSELVALPAATLQELERELAPIGREPHSVLGSTCVGASVIGGICNNSGGALVQRGPAYTEHALYAKLNADGRFILINELGIDLGTEPEDILENLQAGRFNHEPALMQQQAAPYAGKVRDITAATPARCNGDPEKLRGASGSSGHVIVFAVRLPTYEKPAAEHVYFYSCDDSTVLSRLRRQYLADSLPLPILAEYLDENYARITQRFGRDTCLIMNRISGSNIGSLYRLRSRIEAFVPSVLIDRLLQLVSCFLPKPLTGRLEKQAKAHRHHLIIKAADTDAPAIQAFLTQFQQKNGGALSACTEREGQALLTVRFAGTAAMLRYYSLNQKCFADLISTDIALPRNQPDFRENLPAALADKLGGFFSLGHFFCYVFHQDYFLKTGTDKAKFKEDLLAWYSAQHIAYPAEHNVGHEYPASAAQKAFFQQLDPANRLNPGIGKTTKEKDWRTDGA